MESAAEPKILGYAAKTMRGALRTKAPRRAKAPRRDTGTPGRDTPEMQAGESD
jgi:hypothetical protein